MARNRRGTAIIELGPLLRDALAPTAAAICWCAFLFHLKLSCLNAENTSVNVLWLTSTTITRQTWKDLDWAASRILASLGVVTGMLLAFRSNSALDRWSTARRKWSDVHSTSRSLLRLLASSLSPQVSTRVSKDESLETFAKLQGHRAQVESVLATIPFFSIGLMCQMRGLSISSSNILRSDLIEQLPSRLRALIYVRRDAPDSIPSAPINASKEDERRREKEMLNDDSPRKLRSRAKASTDCQGTVISANMALSSLVYLQRSIDIFHKNGQAKQSLSAPSLSGPVYAHSIGLLNSLNSHMTELERIRDTPIPLSVATHFSRLLMIHVAVLPFILTQALESNLPLCLIIQGVVAGMLYGVDSFAATLGQPFGMNREDLPLERYVADTQREWAEIRACAALFHNSAAASKPNLEERHFVNQEAWDQEGAAQMSDSPPASISEAGVDHQAFRRHSFESEREDDFDHTAAADESALRDTFSFD